MIYDFLIIGAGVVGCNIARELSKYNANVCVVERHNDVGCDASGANSSIVHSGYDPVPGSLKAKMNVRGNELFEELCKNLSVHFERIGSITVALDESEIEDLKKLEQRARENHVPVKLLSKEELRELEPQISDSACMGLLAPTCGVVNNFQFVVANMELAMDNGVKLFLNYCVKRIEYNHSIYTIYGANEGQILQARFVINAAGLYSDSIAKMIGEAPFKLIPRKGEYYLLDHFSPTFVRHTLFMLPTAKGKGVLVSPTGSKNYLVGPSSEVEEDKENTSCDTKTLVNIRSQANQLVKNIPFDQTIRQFSGVRSTPESHDFYIDYSKKVPNFIHLGGIESPGFASSPAIAEYIISLILEKEVLTKKENYISKRKPNITMSKLSIEEKNQVIKENSKYGHIICRCEKISEGEILDCIRRNCGATTVQGVKRRVRAGFGKCQGTFCEKEVIRILSRELNVPVSEICMNDKNTNILKYSIDQEDER